MTSINPIHIISLGAGVQSSTMALMAAKGEITPMPVAAIFADTQAEPKSVYIWLDWLEKQLPFPVYRVTAGNLYADIAKKRPKGKFRVVDIPAFVKVSGSIDGLINRSCTRDYKIIPIQKKVRELCGLTRKKSPDSPVATQWIGISIDEISRVKDSREPWIENRWPLIELRMSRQNCLAWMRKHGYPKPPKSACTFCPYHSDAAWRSLDSDAMDQAIEIDRRLRVFPATEYRTKGVLYLHRSGKPLDQVDFSTEEDRGQLNMFNNECEGLCGV
jgi:hypothetical protein